jgi:transcriptional regulator with XRE-family HTH domain
MKYVEAKKAFGAKLKKYREEKSLTQKDVSKVLKFKTTQFVSNVERSVTLPPLPMLGKLIKLYKLNQEKVLKDYVNMVTLDFRERLTK